MDRRRVRIAQLIYNLDIERGGGGISRLVIELCQNLDPGKFDVVLLSLWRTGTEQEQQRLVELNSAGLSTRTLADWQADKPYRAFLKMVKALINEASKGHVDIIHSHSEFSDIAAILLKILFPKISIIRTIHYGYSVEWRKRPLRRALLTNFLYPILFHREIGVSQAITDRLNQRTISRLLSRRAIIINNGISLKRLIPSSCGVAQVKKNLGIPAGSPIVGTVGRLVEQKGYRYFIRAANKVLHDMPNVIFMHIGDGELKEELINLSISEGISSNCHFLGPRTDMPDIYRCMDLFVSSSLWEGFPIVLLESMACNVPIIATDIPGTREIITHGRNGWLVPPSDPEALAGAILFLLNSPELRQEIITNAQTFVGDYIIEEKAHQYETEYLKCTHED